MKKSQYVVWTGLTYSVSDAKYINSFFKDKNWGKLTYKMKFKTLPGFGGSGGRSDVVFKWSGTSDQLQIFAVGRFNLDGISWVEDYISNNRQIIPAEKLKTLKQLSSW